MQLCCTTLAKLGWPELGPPSKHILKVKKKEKSEKFVVFFFFLKNKKFFLNKPMKFYIDFSMSKYHRKVLRKQGKYIFGNEKPVSFWGPKAGPRPPAN